jgi:hypothetical protein
MEPRSIENCAKVARGWPWGASGRPGTIRGAPGRRPEGLRSSLGASQGAPGASRRLPNRPQDALRMPRNHFFERPFRRAFRRRLPQRFLSNSGSSAGGPWPVSLHRRRVSCGSAVFRRSGPSTAKSSEKRPQNDPRTAPDGGRMLEKVSRRTKQGRLPRSSSQETPWGGNYPARDPQETQETRAGPRCIKEGV